MQMLDESQRRDLLLKNAKSLGNSLGTANKKTLNLSHQGNAGLGLAGIEREQSTLNDAQFFTLAKTGLLNNLNLSQLIRSQNILEEDGIEDLHFYFVSFNNHKSKVLLNQELKLKKSREQQNSKQGGPKGNVQGKPSFKKGEVGKVVGSPTSSNVNGKSAENEQVRTIETLNDEELNWND